MLVTDLKPMRNSRQEKKHSSDLLWRVTEYDACNTLKKETVRSLFCFIYKVKYVKIIVRVMDVTELQ